MRSDAQATFQTLMNSIFEDIIDLYVVVYMDNLLIFSKTAEEHVSHVDVVLSRPKEHQLYVSSSKRSFAQ